MDTVINDNNNDFWHGMCVYTWVWWMRSNQVHEQGIKKCENKSIVVLKVFIFCMYFKLCIHIL